MAAVAPVLLPHLRGRPLTLYHCPAGIAGDWISLDSPPGRLAGPLQSVKPWRQADVLGKPQGRRG